MEDSFSILGLDKEELCELANEKGEEVKVAHYVFDDLLDSQEKLLCKKLELEENFCVYSYFLKKESKSFFSRTFEKTLGCFLAYREGVTYCFEDFNFKIYSLEDFTLLVEAVETVSGKSFFFELCNLCEVPERLLSEHYVNLILYSNRINKLFPLSRIDQLADEHRVILKLAVKGNEKAVEKL